MRITKYVHSCLLIETDTKTVLIDPGKYSWDSHLLPIGKLERLDFIVVTHAHQDHYYPPFLKALAEKFPHTPIITNSELAAQMATDGVKNKVVSGSEDGMQVFEAAHEPLPMNEPAPRNIGIHIDELLTHPGDALRIEQCRSIIALPITAPWGSFKQAVEYAAELKPKMVIPVHDYHWHNAARKELYSSASWLLAPKGIKFIELENATPVEL